MVDKYGQDGFYVHFPLPGTHARRGVTRAREKECVALNGFSRLNLSRALHGRDIPGARAPNPVVNEYEYRRAVSSILITSIVVRAIVVITVPAAASGRDAMCPCPSDVGGSLEVMKIDRVADDNTTRQSDLTVN